MNKNMIAESGNTFNMFFKERIQHQVCIYFLSFIFILQTDVWAQESVLTLNKAIELTLSNNFDVKITEIDKERNKNNDQAGNASMLPRLDLNGSYTKSNLNTHQSYSSGQEVNRDNVSSENLNANAVLT
ncbi:MAG TPA: TolC family protein, partial [Bacteroidia bacterium]|nr:TolC family protein [Bacteroidia bacterium]